MNVPADLRYTSDHEWVRVEESGLRVGITDYAQDALGDVVFVELPTVGSDIEAGTSIGEIESTKSVSDIYAPVAGTVTEVNEALDTSPGQLNDDPYGDGWLCMIAVASPEQIDQLLDASAYEALISE